MFSLTKVFPTIKKHFHSSNPLKKVFKCFNLKVVGEKKTKIYEMVEV